MQIGVVNSEVRDQMKFPRIGNSENVNHLFIYFNVSTEQFCLGVETQMDCATRETGCQTDNCISDEFILGEVVERVSLSDGNIVPLEEWIDSEDEVAIPEVENSSTIDDLNCVYLIENYSMVDFYLQVLIWI